MSQEKLEFLYVFRTEGEEKIAKLVGLTQQLEAGSDKAAASVGKFGAATTTAGGAEYKPEAVQLGFTKNELGQWVLFSIGKKGNPLTVRVAGLRLVGRIAYAELRREALAAELAY